MKVEFKRARANVIDVSKLDNDGKVIFGSTILLQNLDTDENVKYKIVGKLSLIHISEPTRHASISYAVFCLKKRFF